MSEVYDIQLQPLYMYITTWVLSRRACKQSGHGWKRRKAKSNPHSWPVGRDKQQLGETNTSQRNKGVESDKWVCGLPSFII